MGDTAAREAWACIVQQLRSDEHARRFAESAAVFDLTPTAQKALLDLEPGGAKPMRDLAAKWFCDASNVTSLIDQLEQRGLVERRVPPNDRRVKAVSLTEQGVSVRASLIERLSAPPAGFAALAAAEQRALRDLLRKATAGLAPLK
ncbi:hypothetical protein BH18ACT4_BH18ACT4_09510 [soil metagenome]